MATFSDKLQNEIIYRLGDKVLELSWGGPASLVKQRLNLASQSPVLIPPLSSSKASSGSHCTQDKGQTPWSLRSIPPTPLSSSTLGLWAPPHAGCSGPTKLPTSPSSANSPLCYGDMGYEWAARPAQKCQVAALRALTCCKQEARSLLWS